MAFVVALWAAYFVPLVLRRYDEAGKNASLDHEDATRRVVAPRRPTVAAEQRRVETVAASAPAAPAPVAQAEPSQQTSPRVDRTSPAVGTKPPRVSRETARRAAARRRNVLLTLVGVLAILAGLSVASILPVWSPAVGVGLIASWLVLCRVMVRGERGISSASGRKRVGPALGAIARALGRAGRGTLALARGAMGTLPRNEAGSGSASDDEMTVVVSHQVEEYDPDQRHTMERDVPLEASALDEQLQIAVPSVSASTGEPLWDPLPVTVPTYVTKPRAGRTVRTIEFGEPGAWTSGHVEGEQTELPIGERNDDDGTEQHAVGH